MKASYVRFVHILQNCLITTSLIYFCCFQVNASSQKQLEHDIATLTSNQFYGRKTNTVGAKRAAEYITQRFSDLGYQIQRQDFHYSGTFYQQPQASNIIAVQPNSCQSCKLIVLTAHYDHLGLQGSRLYPGANDNASGVAALLYIAAIFAEKTSPYKLVFVATDAEENGLHGSDYFVSTLNPSDVKLKINLDMLVVNQHKPRMIAFLNHQSQYKNAINSLSDEKIRFIATSSSHYLNRLFDLKVNWLKASDHYSFAKADIPYIYFGMGHDKHHHQSTDTIAHINFDLYEHAIQKIAEFMDKLTD